MDQFVGEEQLATLFRRDAGKFGSGFIVAAGNQSRHARLEDSGFLSGNFLTGAAKYRTVVQSYGSNYAENGIDNIRTVKPAAQSALHYHAIRIVLRKP